MGDQGETKKAAPNKAKTPKMEKVHPKKPLKAGMKRPMAKPQPGAGPPSKFRKNADGKPMLTKKNSFFAANDQKKKPDAAVDAKPKWFEMKKKDRKKMRQQQDNKFYQLQLDAKKLWEKLRRSDVRSEERNQIAAELLKLIKGNIANIVEAHDTSRVVECLYTNGNPEIKNSVFDELKAKVLHYMKCKYAKNVVMALLRHGSQAHKEEIYKAVQRRIPDLFLHKEAANIISTLFDDYCNNKKKAEMAQEFYSKELTYFKSDDVVTFKDAYEKCADKTAKQAMLSDFKEQLLKLTDKGVIKYGLYHMLLHQLFEVLTDKEERLDMIRQIQHILVEILHTKEGMQVALQCIWHAGSKERKAIAKTFKQFIVKIATDDQGHKVMMGLFDTVDDTVMLNQSILSELIKNRTELLKNRFGAKVLVYLMVGRDPCVITPDTVELLKRGDGNENSKKEPEVRRKELKKIVQQPLIETICENIEELIKDGEISVAIRDVILAADEDFQLKAMHRIADLLKSPYDNQTKDHIVESKHGNFFLTKLLVNDKESGKATFSNVVKEKLGEDVVRSWWKCNRGAFLCLRLLEVEDEGIKSWAKKVLSADTKLISQEKSKGAELLLQKLST